MNKNYYLKTNNGKYLANNNGVNYWINEPSAWAIPFSTPEEAKKYFNNATAFKAGTLKVVFEEPWRNPNFSEKVKIVGI